MRYLIVFDWSCDLNTSTMIKSAFQTSAFVSRDTENITNCQYNVLMCCLNMFTCSCWEYEMESLRGLVLERLQEGEYEALLWRHNKKKLLSWWSARAISADGLYDIMTPPSSPDWTFIHKFTCNATNFFIYF